MRMASWCVFALALAAAPWWTTESSGVDANLRGVSVAVNSEGASVWATGNKGAVVRSTDSGKSWTALYIPEGETLDFRGVQAFEGNTAYVMSSGDGEKSRIYKTEDGGKNWERQYGEDRRKGFFLDGIACRDARHCYALSDPVNGKFLVLATADGKHWAEMAEEGMPEALPGEGAFAASNSSLRVYGNGKIYFVTGGAAARVFRSADSGKTWTVSETPILSGKPAQGIFSVARSGETIVVVGGDYSEAARAERNAAYSVDGGKSWKLGSELPAGYRSSVEATESGFVAVGPTGSDASSDGVHWRHGDTSSWNAACFVGKKGWTVGPHGTVGGFVGEGVTR